jgi:tetratricopeptide (TPR) repeat protein
MQKSIVITLAALLMLALCVPPVWSQVNSAVKGFAKDEQGKPIVDAVVTLVSKETGRKFSVKTDKKGEFYSLGLSPGMYNITLTGKEGQKLWAFDNVRINFGQENIVNFDMAKERAEAAKSGQAQMSPEQKKALEEQEKQRQKIQGLNQMLAAAKTAEDAGNYDEAIRVLKEATQADPTQHLLWGRLGDVSRASASKLTDPAAKKQRYDDAVDAYQKAIAIRPVGAYYNNMGEAFAKSGRTEEAIKTYQEAAQIDPPAAGQYYFNLGAVLTNTGKVDEAIQAFDKSIAAEPARADSYYWKGVNMIGKATLQGNKMIAPEGTAEAFNKYLELQPTGQFAEPAKQMLASIGAPIETSFGKAKGAAKKK